MLKELYRQVEARLERLDFDRLWPEFHPFRFALYDDKKVILGGTSFAKTDQFLANTTIEFDGEWIAIWKVSEPLDGDVLAAKIVHEMFHAFQKEKHESRFANEMEAVFLYAYDHNHLRAKYEENKLLTEYATHPTAALMDEFLSIRKYRSTRFPFEYDYENRIETIEGAAQFVELEALKILDGPKFDTAVMKLIERIRKPESLFPIRILCYDVGALLLMVAKMSGFEPDLSIDGREVSFFHPFVVNHRSRKTLEWKEDEAFERVYAEDQTILDRRVKDALAQNQIRLQGDFELIGFNAYSARYHEGYLLSEYFLMVRDKKEHILYGNFVAAMKNHRVMTIYEIKENKAKE